jgi:hypothetical protein
MTTFYGLNINPVMKHFVLEMPVNDQEGEELGLILNGLVDDDEQEQTFVLALVVVTVLAGVVLVGTGLYLSLFWGV